MSVCNKRIRRLIKKEQSKNAANDQQNEETVKSEPTASSSVKTTENEKPLSPTPALEPMVDSSIPHSTNPQFSLTTTLSSIVWSV